MSSKLLQTLDNLRHSPGITLGRLSDELKDQALVMVCLISILPFLQPIPVPGLSTILGFVTLLQGISLILGKKPLLTRKMKEVEISPERFEVIYKAAQTLTKVTSKISVTTHPWTNSRASRLICGIAIIFSAAFLALPLPIPFSNSVPAFSIAFICMGLLEEDIFLVITGISITVAVMLMSVYSYHLIVEKLPTLF